MHREKHNYSAVPLIGCLLVVDVYPLKIIKPTKRLKMGFTIFWEMLIKKHI